MAQCLSKRHTVGRIGASLFSGCATFKVGKYYKGYRSETISPYNIWMRWILNIVKKQADRQ